jgi:hypothetical protein
MSLVSLEQIAHEERANMLKSHEKAEAHRLLESRTSYGKIVLCP